MVAGPGPWLPQHLLYLRKKNKFEQTDADRGGPRRPKKKQQHITMTERRDKPKATPCRALKLGKQPAAYKVSGHPRVAESWTTGGTRSAHEKLKCPADLSVRWCPGTVVAKAAEEKHNKET
ncbi:hypothetical protein NDU88_005730 [Pleurodeles waltl]|uniref:Uncharacterized protein n=1 Tax=Pleurodeles waltl TaxID=8319 RepID=A0AAV7NNA0_PLEWA|nr:hypothetical protein NDU88_005730 [Pleurodeles waltl]